jgi:large subunit ribosomal protein L10
MPRPEKVQAVAEIKERLESARAVFLAEYAGLSVKEQQDLRRSLRATEGEFKVVKMTLARLAAQELGHEGLIEMLSGPTGLTFAAHDAAATAKALRDFANDHAALIIKGALLSGEILPPERVAHLADLEPRDVLLSRIAGAFQAPMAKMARLAAAMPRDLATMVKQLIDKLPAGEEPEPEAAEAPPEDAPAEPETAADGAAEAEAAEEEPVEEAAEEAAEETAEEGAADEAGKAEAGEPEAADDEADEKKADEAEEE